MQEGVKTNCGRCTWHVSIISLLSMTLVLSVTSTSDSHIYICEICTQVLDWNLPSIEFYKRRGVTTNWQPISPAFICWAAKLPQNYYVFCRYCLSWSIQHHLALGLFPHKTYGYMSYVTCVCDKNNFSGCCLDLPPIVEMINLLSGATNLTHEDGKLIFQVIMRLTMEMMIVKIWKNWI